MRLPRRDFPKERRKKLPFAPIITRLDREKWVANCWLAKVVLKATTKPSFGQEHNEQAPEAAFLQELTGLDENEMRNKRLEQLQWLPRLQKVGRGFTFSRNVTLNMWHS